LSILRNPSPIKWQHWLINEKLLPSESTLLQQKRNSFVSKKTAGYAIYKENRATYCRQFFHISLEKWFPSWEPFDCVFFFYFWHRNKIAKKNECRFDWRFSLVSAVIKCHCHGNEAVLPPVKIRELIEIERT
jgi:hypothetical protein